MMTVNSILPILEGLNERQLLELRRRIIPALWELRAEVTDKAALLPQHEQGREVVAVRTENSRQQAKMPQKNTAMPMCAHKRTSNETA